MSALRQPSRPRRSPCASCPYRCGSASGVWAAEEYEKLPRYDGDISEQTSVRVFMCHQGDGDVCAGWLGHRDPSELLAVRVGVMDGSLDPSCVEYTTPVPLFGSGQAAAVYGMRDIANPDEGARAVIDKLVRKRGLSG